MGLVDGISCRACRIGRCRWWSGLTKRWGIMGRLARVFVNARWGANWRESPALVLKNSGRPRGAPQIPPLRFAPVGMTPLFGVEVLDGYSGRPRGAPQVPAVHMPGLCMRTAYTEW